MFNGVSIILIFTLIGAELLRQIYKLILPADALPRLGNAPIKVTAHGPQSHARLNVNCASLHGFLVLLRLRVSSFLCFPGPAIR